MERRALYNLLRMNWLNDPTTPCERWQVEDYRTLDTTQLFAGLQSLGVSFDQSIFFAYAQSVDSPEELTDLLLEDSGLEPIDQDHIYLYLFEVWRRLLPEKMSLSVFCDELDHQIFLFDKGDAASAEAIQDVIANLQDIMDDNVDQGGEYHEIFDQVSRCCANDLESFLYDFIAEQIDDGDINYGTELLEAFDPYIIESKWFDLLKVRILELTDPGESQKALRKLINKAVKEDDLPFYLEMLSFISLCGEKGDFNKMVRKTVPLLKVEEDFKELLEICEDYYRCLDEDQKEQTIQELLQKRTTFASSRTLKKNDPSLDVLLKVLK